MEPPLRIAFVCPQMTNAFARATWHGLQSVAGSWGIRLTAVLGGPMDQEGPIPVGRRVYDLVDKKNFDGVILHSAGLSDFQPGVEMARFLAALAPLPVVSLGVEIEGVPSIVLDQRQAFRDLVFHLYHEHGLRRFVFIGGPESHIEARIRKQGFLDAMIDLEAPTSVRLFPGLFSRSSGDKVVRALAEDLIVPTALVCANDETALGALEAARQLGIGVPHPLAVTGFDDIRLASCQEPALTTAAQPLIAMALKALRILMDRIRGDGVDDYRFPAPIVLRGSCGCRPSPVPPRDKVDLVIQLISDHLDHTESALAALRSWTSDYLTAFEYLLETGNITVLKSLWDRYHELTRGEHERGLNLGHLFSGLEVLYGAHPSFPSAHRENLMLAHASESRQAALREQESRGYFRQVHRVEALLVQANDRAAVEGLPFGPLRELGILALALVRFAAPPKLVYFRTSWTGPENPAPEDPIDYPGLLPQTVETFDLPAHRLVIALTAENTYLGYAVFWCETEPTFVCDLLANLFAGTLHRIELLDQVREQSRTLKAALEESQRVQKQLVETEKVASLARLVAGVAHEINTPLGTGITGASFLAERLEEVQALFQEGKLPRSGFEQFLDQGKLALEGVLRNLLKAGELIQAFKGLGLDHGQGEWKPIQIRTLLSDLVVVYEGEFARRRMLFRAEMPSEGTVVYSQPSALIQVVGELLENAMEHAFPPENAESPQVLLQVSIEENTLRMAVTDNGRGLTAEERRHLFDPLFTTRRPEGHAGLGLHLAFQLVTRTLGGQMTVATEPGGGSCFLCLIPLRSS